MERPALQGLLADIRAGRIDILVIYKVDRLTQSLANFARLVEIFDAQDATFVPLRSQLNTTSEMWGTSRSICRTPFSTQRSTDGLLRLSTAVGWNEQNRHPGDERFANVSRAPSAVHGRKVCEAKELIRKVAAPGSGRQVAGEAI